MSERKNAVFEPMTLANHRLPRINFDVLRLRLRFALDSLQSRDVFEAAFSRG